jgi:hypothetical protein
MGSHHHFDFPQSLTGFHLHMGAGPFVLVMPLPPNSLSLFEFLLRSCVIHCPVQQECLTFTIMPIRSVVVPCEQVL